MKLRQKLAMVLAATMIVTAVPVVTMASTTNGYNQTKVVAKGDILDATTGLGLEVKIDAGDTLAQNKTFYVKATDFEFVQPDGTTKLNPITISQTNGTTVTPVATMNFASKTSASVTIDAAAGVTGKLVLPIQGKVTGTQPTITLDGEGTLVSSGKYPILGADVEATDKKLTATVGDVTNISVDGVGKIANITINEVTSGKLSGQKVTIELDNTDLAFDYTVGDKVAFEGVRGLAGLETIATGSNWAANTGTTANHIRVDAIDKEEITLEFVGFTGEDRGSVILKGLKVKSDTRGDVSTGDVKATITAAGEKTMAKVEEKVAVVADYAVKASVKDDKVVEFVAGGASKEVTFTLEELAAGTLTDRHNVYFTIEGAEIVKIDGKAIDTFVTDKKYYDLTGTNTTSNSVLTYDKDDKEFTLDLGSINENEISKYTLKVELKAKPDTTEDVKVVFESKGFEEDVEVVVGNVKTNKEIKVEKANVVIGTKGQKGGSVVITEDEAKVFGKNDILYVAVDSDAARDGLRIKGFDIEADGVEAEKVDAYYVTKEETVGTGNAATTRVIVSDELTTAKEEVINGRTHKNEKATNVVAVKITKQSKEAGSLELNNFVIDTTYGTPDGTYDVKLSGDLIGGEVKKEFIEVGVGAADKQAKVVVTIGESTFEIDGEEVTVETAPFIDENDRTMVPVRAIAEAFGCKLDFFFPEGSDQLVITMTKGNKYVQFQNGSNVMVVDGAQRLMSTKAVIKDGYTYVPVAFLAQALNIEYTWLPETQQVVFGN